jgi:hypothetical protein
MPLTSYGALTVVHVSAGVLAIVAGSLALAAPSRRRVHRNRGRWFLYAMLGLVGTGVLMLGLRPDLFAASLVLIAGYASWSGIRALRRRRGTAAPRDWAAALAAAVVAAWLVWLALGSHDGRRVAAISTAGSVLLYATFDLVHFALLARTGGTVPEAYPVYLYEHIFKVMGAFGGVLGAFSGTVLTTLPSPWREIVPNLVLGCASAAVIVRLARRHRLGRVAMRTSPLARAAAAVVLMTLAPRVLGAQADVAAERVQDITLSDQFGVRHDVRMDGSSAAILVIADRAGAAAAREWGMRLGEAARTASRAPETRILAIAALGGVPRLLRAVVRRSFGGVNPVLLDWSGDVARARGFSGGCLVVHVASDGRVLARAEGAPSPEAAARLIDPPRGRH